MVHVVTFEPRLGDVLAFEQSEFLSQVNKVGGSEQRVFQVVAFEDIVNVECLNFIHWNWEVF